MFDKVNLKNKVNLKKLIYAYGFDKVNLKNVFLLIY